MPPSASGKRGLLRAAIGGVAVGALGYLMRSMVKDVTRDDASAADGGTDTGRPGRGRTEGDMAVDETIGQGPLPQK